MVKKFGKAGNKVVIEEFLNGFEMSIVFFDKNSYSKLIMPLIIKGPMTLIKVQTLVEWGHLHLQKKLTMN